VPISDTETCPEKLLSEWDISGMSWTLYGDALSGEGGRRMSELRIKHGDGYATVDKTGEGDVKVRMESFGKGIMVTFIDPADLARFLKENFPEVIK
jgi:hypothetical protein